MAFFKLTKWREAEQDCTEALKLDPKNVKVWWRRAMARKALGDYEKAKQDLEKGLIFDSTQELLREELKKLHAEMAGPPIKKMSISEIVKPLSPSTQRKCIPIREVMEEDLISEPLKPDIKSAEKEDTLIIHEKASKELPSSPPPLVTFSVHLRSPENSLDFERTFRLLKHQPEQLYMYLQVSLGLKREETVIN
jgi:tetratricopeptide (TPR) repeat protein